MFPVLGIIDEGLRATLRFVRAYPLQVLAFTLTYIAAAALLASRLIHLPLPQAAASQTTVWLAGTIATLLLAPVWTALYRFAILGDADRGWWPIDVRIRRVAFTMLVLSVVGLIGATPFAIGLDVLPRIGPRRLVAVAALGVAVLVKLVAWWLAARLAIGPAMAATGTKPHALDVAFAYTKRNAPRLLVTRLIVYLPLLAVIGVFFLVGSGVQGTALGGFSILGISNVIVTALVTAATELVDGAVFARAAVALVKAQRAHAAGRPSKARADGD